MEQLERAFAFFDIEYEIKEGGREYWASERLLVYRAITRGFFVAVNYNLDEKHCMESPNAFTVVAQVYQWMQ